VDLKSYIRDVPGYPKPGIIFKDITPLWKDPAAFQAMVEQLVGHYRGAKVDVITAIESRGLILGSAMAFSLGAGLVPIRKAGKLPWNTVKASYSLEYGSATSELHTDAFSPGARVLIVDDLLATGGTAEAAGKLVAMLQGKIVGFAFLVELSFLKGREHLAGFGAEVFSLIEYHQP
jgi:adenine phosphoribosyltransferase